VPLVLADRDENWRRREGISVPGDTSALGRNPEGKLIAIGASGIYRQTSELTARQRADLVIFGMRLPAAFNAGPSGFEQVLATRLTPPFSAAVDPTNGEVAIYNREVLSSYAPGDDGRYRERVRKELPGSDTAIVARGDQIVLLGAADGELCVYSTDNLSLRTTFEPRPGVAPRFIEASPNGRLFAILFHDRSLWLYDAVNDTLSQAPVSGQDDICGVAFHGDDRLLVADRVSRVSEHKLPGYELVRRVENEPDWLEALYRCAVVPLYTVFPKPTQISNVTAYLIAEQRTFQRGGRDGDLHARQIPLEIWGPIWSNVAFLAVVLCLGCIYTARTDF
jgi:hypothetical protein